MLYCLCGKCPNQRFLVIESLKSPSRGTSVDFAGLIIRFLHNTGPTKLLEGCRLEKVGPFPAGHPGRNIESVNNMAHPSKHTNAHIKVWLLLPHYGDTSVYPSNWVEEALLFGTLLEHTVRGILVKTMPPYCVGLH